MRVRPGCRNFDSVTYLTRVRGCAGAREHSSTASTITALRLPPASPATRRRSASASTLASSNRGIRTPTNTSVEERGRPTGRLGEFAMAVLHGRAEGGRLLGGEVPERPVAACPALRPAP